MANKLEELPIYYKEEAFWTAVTAILESPRLRKDRRLHEQIADANNSITSNMVEGFEQGTDRAFANFLTHSKASLAEVSETIEASLLQEIHLRGRIERAPGVRRGTRQDVGGFIKYLRRSDWNDRGSHGL